jgi:hypothetical protein
MNIDPLDLRIERIASLTEAATTIFLGSCLADVGKKETIVLDLLSMATALANQLAAENRSE